MSSLRALGGGELHGDKLVRITYLDESGTSSRQQEPFIVVAGVLVHGDHQLNKLRQALDEVLRKHVPSDADTLVLHTCDIYGGNKFFDKSRKPEWTIDKRCALLDDIAALPKRLNLWITFGHVEKSRFPATDLAIADDAEAKIVAIGAAYMSCLIEVDQWFRQNARRENTIVIVEDNRETRKFIGEQHRIHQNPEIAATLTEKERNYFPLRHIQEDPAFQPKRVSHPLIVADFIAFFVKRLLMKDPHAKRFCCPWWGRVAMGRVKLPPL
jgi:hypothetical protein